MRFFRRCDWNREASFVLRFFSMTTITSAHSMSSGVTEFSASGLKPADAHSTFGYSENTCSAVGLRQRLRLQMKSMRVSRLHS